MGEPMTAELLAEPDKKRDPSAPLPHCGKCGRFIRHATLRGGGIGMDGEYTEVTGHCATCGYIYVSWEPA